MSFFALSLSDYLASRSTFLRRLSWGRAALVIWSVASVTFGLSAIVADQLYLEAWRNPPFSPEKLELAAKVFPFDRNIATSPGYYYLLMNKASLISLHAIREALGYDPAAADLIQAEMIFAFQIGKNGQAIDAFNRLKRISLNAKIIKEIEEKGNGLQ